MRFFHSKWLLLPVLIVLGWLGLSLFNIKSQNHAVDKEAGGLEHRIGELEKSNALFQKTIDLLGNPKFLEQEARARLNYKSSDEKVAVVFLDDSARASGSADSKNGGSLIPGFIQWLKVFIKKNI